MYEIFGIITLNCTTNSTAIGTQVAELTGHEERVLHLAMSPGETAVMSAGADETLRLWNCFQSDPNKKKSATGRKIEPRSALDALTTFR